MGVTIHYKIAQRVQWIKQNLDKVQKVAELYQQEAGRLGVPFAINRVSDERLYINIGNCETLALDFKRYEQLNEWTQKNEQIALLNKDNSTAHYDTWPEQKLLYCVGFTKTQYIADLWEHKAVADLIKIIAGYSLFADVYDEGDYYHTGNLEDTAQSIKNTFAVINSTIKTLSDLGHEGKRPQ